MPDSILGTEMTIQSFLICTAVSLVLGILGALVGLYRSRSSRSFAVTLAILPAGGFITLGLLLALINRIGEWNARRHGAPAPLPVNLDCRHCTMCPAGK